MQEDNKIGTVKESIERSESSKTTECERCLPGLDLKRTD